MLNNKNSQGLWEYYEKSPMELTQQFINDNNSLSKSEMDRLIHELGFQERKLLEENLDPNHPIFSKIKNNKKFEIRKGFEIIQ
ncbi:MAG: hypothetical protein ACTSW5_10960 [Promethearchaeota archaeon]